MKIITSRSNWALQKDDLRAKNYIFTKHKVAIRFPLKNDNYHTAFSISKSDKNVYTRQIHPNLKEVSSPPRLSSLYLSELITENNTKSENELFAILAEQKKAIKNVLTNSFYLAGRWFSPAKNFVTQSKLVWKLRAVQYSVMVNGV